MKPNPSEHPCFNPEARHQFGRVHLPVAPSCNIQCNFCNRKYDCANENRPGVTRTLIKPWQAVPYLEVVLEKNPAIKVVGIAGPGDPFASAAETMETLRLVHQRFPEMLLCVATNGLNLQPYIPELAQLGVSHVTVTVNAVDPRVGQSVYAWVRDGKVIYRGLAAAEVLLERQRAAVADLKAHGITVKINTIVIPGINDHHIGEVAAELSRWGVDYMNCMPLFPAEGSNFASLEAPSTQLMSMIRNEAGQLLPQMTHCTRCRADAVGLLGETTNAELQQCLERASCCPIDTGVPKPYVAVATMEGVLINQHLGEASQFTVFKQDGNSFSKVQVRNAPEPGTGEARWRQLASTLKDCQAILVTGAGESPRKVLEQEGIQVIETDGLIFEALKALYNGITLHRPSRPRKCGMGCSGTAMGCS